MGLGACYLEKLNCKIVHPGEELEPKRILELFSTMERRAKILEIADSGKFAWSCWNFSWTLLTALLNLFKYCRNIAETLRKHCKFQFKWIFFNEIHWNSLKFIEIQWGGQNDENSSIKWNKLQIWFQIQVEGEKLGGGHVWYPIGTKMMKNSIADSRRGRKIGWGSCMVLYRGQNDEKSWIKWKQHAPTIKRASSRAFSKGSSGLPL